MTLIEIKKSISIGDRGDEVSRLHQALARLGRRPPRYEIREQSYGPGTLAIINAIQAEAGITQSPRIEPDSETVRTINTLLEARASETRIVRGTVRDREGRPVDQLIVQAFFADNPKKAVGRGEVKNGTYELEYAPPQNHDRPIDLRLAVKRRSTLIETVPSGDSLLLDAGLLEVIDFIVVDEKFTPRSEFERTKDTLENVLGENAIANLTTDDTRGEDLVQAAARADLSVSVVTDLVRAHAFAKKTKTKPELSFALLRENLPGDLEALHAVAAPRKRAALKSAIEKGTVAAKSGNTELETQLERLKPDPTDEFRAVYSTVLTNNDDLQAFFDKFLVEREDPDFWDKIEADPAFRGRASALKLQTQLGALTNSFAPLIRQLTEVQNIRAPEDLAKLKHEDWKRILATDTVGVPEDTPGDTRPLQIEAYATQLSKQVEAAFPTQVLARELPAGPVRTFLDRNPKFDLRKTRAESYFAQDDVDEPEKETAETLKSYQRLYRLTRSVDDAINLNSSGLKSASDIARLSATELVKKANGLTPERAADLRRKATNTNAAATAIWSSYSAEMNGPTGRLFPGANVERLEAATGPAVPDWQTLFGSADGCHCDQCASVHSASAYLVDLLEFLKDRDALEPLLQRRPDLKFIELSCENTHTPVPTVDLINEILENAVAPPSDFAKFDLSGANAASFLDTASPNKATVSTELAATFAANGAVIQKGTAIDEVRESQMWRISSAAFAYDIHKVNNNSVRVEARSRQTFGDEASLRAVPQYTNFAAYDQLVDAKYPWSLPFERNAMESTLFLEHLGTSIHNILETLVREAQPFQSLNEEQSIKIGLSRLRVTHREKMIITGETPTGEDVWGGAAPADLKNVGVFLNVSHLSFDEFDEVLNTWFVDPEQALSVVDVDAVPDENGQKPPARNCVSAELEIENLESVHLDRFHRFMRLKSRLEWTIAELDNALRLLSANSTQPTISNQALITLGVVKQAMASLRLGAMDTLTLWFGLDAFGENSFYARLVEPALASQPAEAAGDFTFDPSTQDLFGAGKDANLLIPSLQAIAQLDEEEITVLTSGSSRTLSLELVSKLYAFSVLSKAVRVSISDLQKLITFLGFDPFDRSEPEALIWLVNIVQTIRDARVDVGRLSYWLDREDQAIPSLAPELSELNADAVTLRESLTAEISAMPTDSDDESDDATLAAEAAPRQRIAQWVADRFTVATETAESILSLPHGDDSFDSLATALEAIEDVDVSLPPPEEGDTTDDAPANAVEPGYNYQNAAPQLIALRQIYRVADILDRLSLTGPAAGAIIDLMSWLEPDNEASTREAADWIALFEISELIENTPSARFDTLFKELTRASDSNEQAPKQILVRAIATLLDAPPETIESFIGPSAEHEESGLWQFAFGATAPLPLIARLSRALTLCQTLGSNPDTILDWVDKTDDREITSEIRQIAKSRYDQEEWLNAVTPIQNQLRDHQRQALVAHLLAHHQSGTNSSDKIEADDLFAHFLIDVEMTSCQSTSRIRQALNSIQTYVQRCLLGLEPAVDVGDPAWRQWEWMKNYRVWEANRKVWLYPENWIEPDLRDDKSPFFEQLEQDLLQSELTNEVAERALRRYIQSVDEIARLEIVATHEDGDGAVHVIGRTFNSPKNYWYRARDAQSKMWSAWEALDLDIEGDHLIPVVWNRKFTLIWPMFTEKAYKKNATMPGQGEEITAANKYWELRLAWSQKTDLGWSAKQISEPVALEAHEGHDFVKFGPTIVGESHIRDVEIPSEIESEIATTFGSNSPALGFVFLREAFILRFIDHSLCEPDISLEEKVDPEPLKQRRLAARHLFFFKPVLSHGPDGQSLTIRGFLRRDHRFNPDPTDSELVCPFGEFRFSDCKGKVGLRARSVTNYYPISPAGMKFCNQSLIADAGSFLMVDGLFPTKLNPSAVSSIFGVPSYVGGPIYGVVDDTVAARIDKPLFDHVEGLYRVVGDYQDQQFDGDHPFFFSDESRVFLLTSRGGPGRISVIPGDWLDALPSELTKVSYHMTASAGLNDSDAALGAANVAEPTSMNVIARDDSGRRKLISSPVPSVSVSNSNGTVSRVISSRRYFVENFFHPFACDFERTLNSKGVPALYEPQVQTQEPIAESFETNYRPSQNVIGEYPQDQVSFAMHDAYALYNWELFFHIPLLIAQRLRREHRYEESQKWFHFIFDPTRPAYEPSIGELEEERQRYWRTKPFRERTAVGYEAQAVAAIENLIAEGLSAEWNAAISEWRRNPFSPFAVARYRTTAFQKAVFQKYIGLLIDWGDHLFQRATRETVNEATQVYILAAELLGKKPETISRENNRQIRTYETLGANGELSNALVSIEGLIGEQGGDDDPLDDEDLPQIPIPRSLYFCVPINTDMLGLWDTVADRLFKIRHCQDIDGGQLTMELWSPAIDPADLVRARAAGVNLTDVLNQVDAPLPHYRFQHVLQKAQVFTGAVQSFGGALLAAMEKRDAEFLASLRSAHEERLLSLISDVRKQQVEDASAALKAIQKNREIVSARYEFFLNRERRLEQEQIALDAARMSGDLLYGKLGLDLLAQVLAHFPDWKFGSPTTAGPLFGGTHLSQVASQTANHLQTLSSIQSNKSGISSQEAALRRRDEDWGHQASQAEGELEQLDKQIIGAEIRLAIAENELRNHERQLAHAAEVEDYLRSKFTDAELYEWMITQLSGLHYQAYQLAYRTAQSAERCFKHEIASAADSAPIITFGKWNSMRKGLLAGDHLAHDLNRLDEAYTRLNEREFEITKHISLRQLDPIALLGLRTEGECRFSTPEWLFDLDCPGHYRRRVKYVTLTIPSVVGPYTSINCKLTMTNSEVRSSPTVINGNYNREPAEDARFQNVTPPSDAIVTSNANDDAGLFDPNLRDERYLPFEGAGVIADWHLEILGERPRFDFAAISDAIIHIRYTAREAESLREAAAGNVTDILNQGSSSDNDRSRPSSVLLLNLKHDFANAWAAFMASDNPIHLSLSRTYFPYIAAKHDLRLGEMRLVSTDDDLDTDWGDLGTVVNGAAIDGDINNDGVVTITIPTSQNGSGLQRQRRSDYFLLVPYDLDN